jgi:hypothetical protein
MKSDIRRRAGTWPMRAMAFGGMKMDKIADEERASLVLDKQPMALRIAYVGHYGEHAKAKQAGFKMDDILIEAGDLKQRITENAIVGYLLHSVKKLHVPVSPVARLVLGHTGPWRGEAQAGAEAAQKGRASIAGFIRSMSW